MSLTIYKYENLHYYDEIGLFTPTEKSEAGYRLYDDKALEDLQQILFFREFDIPLKEIKAVMENPDLDKNQILQMQKNYAKVVEWYGGKEEYLSVAKNPVSKEVADSYAKRIEVILEKMITKIGCPVDSFEVRELVAEYGFVMKQFSQVKEERGMMLSVAHSYQDAMVKSKIDEKYGEGAAEFFAEAIEEFYKGY